MPHGRLHPETCFKARKKRRRQCDFGEQHQNLFAETNGFGNSFKIGFGFTRPGHPVEDKGVKPARADSGDHCVGRDHLRVIQFWRAEICKWFRQRRIDADRDRFKGPCLYKPADDSIADPRFCREFTYKALSTFQRVKRGGALRGQPCRFKAGAPIFNDRTRHCKRRRRRKDHTQHRGMAGQIIIGDPVDEAAQSLPKWRTFNQFQHRPKFTGIESFIAKNIIIPDHTRQFTRTQRDHHHAPGARLHTRRQSIVERTNRLRQQDDTDTVGGRIHPVDIGRQSGDVTHLSLPIQKHAPLA